MNRLIALVIATSLAIAAIPASPAAASQTPTFVAPWACGEGLHASTYHKANNGHLNEIDFNNLSDGSDAGMPVLAGVAGTVTRSELQTKAGNVVEVTSLLNPAWSTYSIHLARRDVKVGDRVHPATQIGTIGKTGTGAKSEHLHYEQRLNGVAQPARFDGLLVGEAFSYLPSVAPFIISTNCDGVAAVPTSDGNVQLFAISSGQLKQNWFRPADGSIGGWVTRGVGGVQLMGAPTVVPRSGNVMDIFVRGQGGKIFETWYNSATGSWGGWIEVAGNGMAGDVAAVPTSDGNVQLFAISSGQLKQNWFRPADGSIGGWVNI